MSRFTNIVAETLTAAAGLTSVAALITVTVLCSIVKADEGVPSKVVSFADFNLGSEQGAACPGDDTSRQWQQLAARQRCIDDAVARAIRHINNDSRQINDGSLNTIYRAKTGHVVANLAANTVE